MKAISGFIVIILFLAIAGCAGNQTLHPGGGPVGPFVFAVGQTSDNLFSFKASDSGAITPIATAATGHAPSAIVMEALSSFQINLFIADSAANNITVLALDPNSGAATPSGISVPVGTNPVAIGLREPSGIASPNAPADNGTLYVLNQGSSTISALRITDASGHMTEAPGSPFATQADPRAIAVVTGGASLTGITTFVYVANGALGTISAFKANADGSLTELAGSPFAAGANISALSGRLGGGILLASDAGNNKVLGFKIDQAGALTPFAAGPSAAGTQPGAILFAFNDFVYVVNSGSNDVSAFKLDFTSATLTPIPGSPFPAGTTPVALATTRPLQLYVADQGSSQISGYNIDQTTGALTPMPGSPFHTSASPNSLQTLWVMNVD